MNISNVFFVLSFALAGLTMTSCQRSSDEVWGDTRSCGRHVARGMRSLGGKHGDSRSINCKEDFYSEGQPDENVGLDYIPFNEEGYEQPMNRAQSSETPGEAGSQIPSIEAFRDPSLDPRLAYIFRNVFFEYNRSLIKGPENENTIQQVAAYMNQYPNTYIFIEGHCDERGPAAFNLALGARRANVVRDALIQQGANGEHIFTVSYGKERPLVRENHEEAFSKNRRAEFKIYQR
jgi:peptidoglycan-associated lipoprotein